ncbi:MAG: ABC transporter substrate-binding protein, partial [Candidatus Pacebacteria bacterium]|nr:ABC transporter substrate-binding protein [Candidatus Paceibacterota bacterium]
RVTFAFFSDENALATAMKRGQVQGFLASEDVFRSGVAGANSYSYTMPGYFAIFFDAENNKALSEAGVRAALAYATDRQEILDSVLMGKGKTVSSPIDPDVYGIRPASTTYNYDPQKAAQLLDDAGYKPNDSGIRAKTVNRQHAFQFSKNMFKGSSLTADVKELQKCLAREVMPGLDANGNFGDQTLAAVKLFQEKYRADILDPQSIKDPNGDVKLATREKLNAVCFPSGDSTTELNVTLTVSDQAPFTAVADIIKTQWAKIGVAVTVNAVDPTALQRDVIKPRAYQALLFGQSLGMVPDPYAFWHSSQKVDPGLNFSLYENKDADKLMEEARQATDKAAFDEKLAVFQDLVANDAPAIFLYNPDYIYIATTDVKGMKSGLVADMGRRFAGIAEWYTTTKRVWK